MAFTGGEALAEDVAQTLGYRGVGREVLAETIRSYGIPEAKLNEVLEREPHWWDRWIGVREGKTYAHHYNLPGCIFWR